MTLQKDTRLGGRGGSVKGQVDMWSLKRLQPLGHSSSAQSPQLPKKGQARFPPALALKSCKNFQHLQLYGLMSEGSLCLRAKPKCLKCGHDTVLSSISTKGNTSTSTTKKKSKPQTPPCDQKKNNFNSQHLTLPKFSLRMNLCRVFQVAQVIYLRGQQRLPCSQGLLASIKGKEKGKLLEESLIQLLGGLSIFVFVSFFAIVGT